MAVDQTKPTASEDWALYKRLLGFVPNWGHFAISVLGFVLYAAAAALLADLLQLIIDTAGGQLNIGTGLATEFLTNIVGSREQLQLNARWLIPLLMVAVITLRGAGFFLGNYFINSVARCLIHSMRCTVFDRLLLLPSSYFDGQQSGHLLSRITYNVEQVAAAVTDALKIVMREGFTVIALLSYMLYLNWQLTLVFLAVAPLIGAIAGAVSRLFRRYSKRIQESMGNVTHVANETIRAYREVRIYGGADYEQRRFHEASDYNRRQSLKLALTSSLSPPIIQLLVGIAMGALVYLVLPPSSFSELSSGQLVAFLTSAGMLARPIRALSEVLGIIQRGLAAAEDIFAYLDTQAEPDLGKHKIERVSGEIVCKHLSFSYDPAEQPILTDINFNVLPGQTVALVGGSGAGKTTLVNLLCRFYPHSQGQILLDGVDVNEYQLDNLRHHYAFVSQNISLFNDTILNNIAYGHLAGASLDQVKAAAAAANAQEFIEKLPDQYQTMVGEDGLRLSGGQRQRIAIARALLKDAPVLVLDEATSALDTESESHIQQELAGLMAGRTTIVIAHRLSTIEQADLILVMEGGAIVEQGTHESLLAANARYAQLHQRDFNV
ncbi:MAG: lipid A export permease/ATP-binding protein MsbA [Pseudomonadales bacterium]